MTNEISHTTSLKPLSLTVREACRIIGIKDTTFWELIKTGKVKTVMIGRRRLVVYASLEALVSEQSQGPKDA